MTGHRAKSTVILSAPRACEGTPAGLQGSGEEERRRRGEEERRRRGPNESNNRTIEQ